jgi:hypothetical protein
MRILPRACANLAIAAGLVFASGAAQEARAQFFCHECGFHPETFCLGCGGCGSFGGPAQPCGYECTQPDCDMCQVWDSCSGFASNLTDAPLVAFADQEPIAIVTDGSGIFEVADCAEQLEQQALALAAADRTLMLPLTVEAKPEEPAWRQ